MTVYSDWCEANMEDLLAMKELTGWQMHEIIKTILDEGMRSLKTDLGYLESVKDSDIRWPKD